MRKLFSVVAALAIIIFPSVALCEQPDAADIPMMASVQGQIVSVDFVGSKVVVNTGDDEITFHYVDDEVQVEKNGQSISINDLNQGDQVTVRFVDKKHVGLVAVSITDKQPL